MKQIEIFCMATTEALQLIDVIQGISKKIKENRVLLFLDCNLFCQLL
jgi:hypothetical protein